MQYWVGVMNWPLSKKWQCEICGERSLTWGIQHARCRCNHCHTEYMMRDKEGKRVEVPICQLKQEYHRVFSKLWKEHKVPLSEISDEQWDEEFSKIMVEESKKV